MAIKFPVGIEITAYDKASAVVSNTVNRIIGTTGKIGRATAGMLRDVATSTAAQLTVLASGFASAEAFMGYLGNSDEVAKFARQIGWSAAALQELRYAYSLAGVGQEEFDKSVQILSRNVGDLRRKSGSLYTFLQDTSPKLGEALKKASPDQAFELIIKAMEAETDTAKRAALAQAAFGRSGAVMARGAIEGAEAIKKSREEIRKLGGVISDDALGGAEQLGDDIERLKMSFAGVGNAIMRSLVPALIPVVQRTTEWVAANRELIARKVLDAVNALVAAAKALAGWWERNAEAIKRLASGALETIKTTTQFILDHWETLAGVVRTLAEVWIGQKLIGGLTSALALSKTLAATMAAAGATTVGGAKGVAQAAGQGASGAGGLALNVATLVAGTMAVKAFEWVGAAIQSGNEAREYSKVIASTDIANRVARGEKAAQQLLPGELENVRVQFATQQGWGSEQMRRSQDRGTFEAAQFADEVVAYLDRIGRGKGLSSERELGGFQAPQGGMAAPIEIKLSLDMANAPGVKPSAKVTAGRARVMPTYTVRGLRPLGVL